MNVYCLVVSSPLVILELVCMCVCSHLPFVKTAIVFFFQAVRQWPGYVTFAVKADLLPSSQDALRLLLDHPHSSLTVWRNFKTELDPSVTKWLREHTDPHRTFLDIQSIFVKIVVCMASLNGIQAHIQKYHESRSHPGTHCYLHRREFVC